MKDSKDCVNNNSVKGSRSKKESGNVSNAVSSATVRGCWNKKDNAVEPITIINRLKKPNTIETQSVRKHPQTNSVAIIADVEVSHQIVDAVPDDRTQCLE
jgi:hypothetical protein